MRVGRIEFIPGGNRGRYPFCNSLYIEDEVRVIVDPASDPERLRALAEEGRVEVVINTHYHEDHFTYNFLFPEARSWVPEADAPALESLDVLADSVGFSGSPDEERWKEYYREFFNFRPRKADRMIRGGERYDFGETRMEVVHTPGHTPGHCSLWFPHEGLLFLGDYDLTPFGPYYGDRVSSLEDTIRSIRCLRRFPAREYWTSHEEGRVRSGAEEKFERYLGVIQDREERIVDHLSRPRDLEEIIDRWIIYGKAREPVDFFRFAERGMVEKHLARLLRQGRIERKTQGKREVFRAC